MESNERPKILIVDDDMVDRETAKRYLAREYNLSQAETGSDGLNQAREELFSCILLDLGLPDLSGMELIGQISQFAPVIVMTGHGNEVGAVEAMKRGAADYLVKDQIDRDSIKRAVVGAMEKRKLELTIAEQGRQLLEDERLKVLIQLAGSSLVDLNEPISYLSLALDKLSTSDGLGPSEAKLVDGGCRAVADITAIMRRIQKMRLEDEAPLAGVGVTLQSYRVLCLDDDRTSLMIVRKSLENISDEIVIDDVKTASSVAEAIAVLAAHPIDVILSDFRLGDGTARDLMDAVVQHYPDVPVIVISGSCSEDLVADVLREGASDYISKASLSSEKLGAALKRSLERAALTVDLRKSQERMHEMAFTDELTKLYNRRFLQESMTRELDRMARYKGVASFCLLDIDFFKKLNDTHGHAAGDHALRDMGVLLKNAVRRTDLASRYGGEEFALFLPQTDGDAALALAETIREKIEAHEMIFEDLNLRMTVSIGVKTVGGEDPISVMEIISAADGALYRAKEDGRNRVVKA